MASGNREDILVAQPIKKNEKGLEVLRIRCPAGAYWIGDPSTMEDESSWYDNVCMENTGLVVPEEGPPCIFVNTSSDGAFDNCRISTTVASFAIVPVQYMTTTMKKNAFTDLGLSTIHIEKEDFDCLIIGDDLSCGEGVQRIELGSETFKIWENDEDDEEDEKPDFKKGRDAVGRFLRLLADGTQHRESLEILHKMRKDPVLKDHVADMEDVSLGHFRVKEFYEIMKGKDFKNFLRMVSWDPSDGW